MLHQGGAIMDQHYEKNNNAYKIDYFFALYKAVENDDLSRAEILIQNMDIGTRDLIELLNVAKEYENNKMLNFIIKKANYIFLAAARRGDLNTMQLLLQEIVVNSAVVDSAPLRAAVVRGHMHILKFLLNEPKIKKKVDWSNLLCLAAEHNRAEIVGFLVRTMKVNPQEDGHFALRLALSKGFHATSMLLWKYACVDSQAPFEIIFNGAVKNGYTLIINEILLMQELDLDIPAAFRIAAKNGSILSLSCLILQATQEDLDAAYCIAASNNQLEIMHFLEKGNITSQDAAFCLAASKGHLMVVDNLLKKMQPAIREKAFMLATSQVMLERLFKEVPLQTIRARFIEAGKNAQHEVVQYLLAYVAVFDKAMVFQWAAEKGFSKIVQILLKDPDIDPEAHKNLALRKAASHGHARIVDMLLTEGKVNPANYENYAVRWAAKYKESKALDIFLSMLEVNPTEKNHAALCWAIKLDHTDIATTLLQDTRIDPAARENFALRTASARGNKPLVELLLQDPRVNIEAKNNQAIQLARSRKHKEILQLLLEKSIFPGSTDTKVKKVVNTSTEKNEMQNKNTLNF